MSAAMRSLNRAGLQRLHNQALMYRGVENVTEKLPDELETLPPKSTIVTSFEVEAVPVSW